MRLRSKTHFQQLHGRCVVAPFAVAGFLGWWVRDHYRAMYISRHPESIARMGARSGHYDIIELYQWRAEWGKRPFGSRNSFYHCRNGHQSPSA
jgi:hypothetical protein